MGSIKNKKILLGVTGSIAIYKACELSRALIRAGADVRVVMSSNATRFASPMLFEALTANPVSWDMFDEADDKLAHINLSAWADIFLIAPASANFIGKAAGGIADDLISSTFIATDAKVLVAPAMNNRMWANPATQANVQTLKKRGVDFVGPGSGVLACGDVDEGRLSDIEDIVFAVESALADESPIAGKRILVTAGATREFIDDVRFLSNPSTGKMGWEIAREAAVRGGDVILVSGNPALPKIHGAGRVEFTTAEELAGEVFKRFDEAEVIVMTAAVADWRPEKFVGKVKKGDMTSWNIELAPTTDILAELGRAKGDKIAVGFAVETENEIENARDKLTAKNLDLIFV
ncbi:MAG TPA: bifunctional phosphopantothenoylcysteine decarboxylase/phosphopantothenate--cysteine ligase CoaBC, partial [candidate division Zixibacteria bacterium]|nr:bifunctional phosphopantothenoylcysteine decarboxylase/phosphopantothenate--cysteine ligase CoaBC [candidate division Zixibacteria bacterium]